jgi:hypothetical protein
MDPINPIITVFFTAFSFVAGMFIMTLANGC